jgi:nucleoside-diphosphate-sugar epimerase
MNISLLASAMNQPTVRRMIITSSMVTLAPFSWLANPDERIYTAKDINSNPSRTVSSAMEAYWTSKALARSAVSDFVATNNPHFETIQLLPGVVIGPDIRATSTAYLRNHTPLWFLKMSPILGTKLTDPMVSVPIHVDDVARAHVDAIKSSIPGNADYTLTIQSPEGVEWDDMIDVAKRHFPDRVGTKEMPLGGSLPSTRWRVESRDTEKAFGWTLRTFELSARDMIAQYLRLVDMDMKAGEK